MTTKKEKETDKKKNKKKEAKEESLLIKRSLAWQGVRDTWDVMRTEKARKLSACQTLTPSLHPIAAMVPSGDHPIVEMTSMPGFNTSSPPPILPRSSCASLVNTLPCGSC